MKTVNEINEKIRRGEAVVFTATEAKRFAEERSVEELAEKVDIVTTATFSPMCSSGIFINTGHTKPAMKMQKATLDGVPAYGGVAAVDLFLGVTEENPDNPEFGGAHVIHKLIKGEKVRLKAEGRPSHCYPGSSVDEDITLETLNQAYFYNPRNCYQNYNAAYNSSDEPMDTYMGRLQPGGTSVNFAGSGELSPLFNDPFLRSVGIGTRIFFGGGEGYVTWEGTQFNGEAERDPATGIPIPPSATLGIHADLRNVKPDYIQPVHIPGYGVSIHIAMGIAIPVFDLDMAESLTVRNRDIKTRVVDYATGEVVKITNYEALINRDLEVNGTKVKVSTLSKNRAAQEITEEFKKTITEGGFFLTEPVRPLQIHGRVTGFGVK